jgi:hypothetical protein
MAVVKLWADWESGTDDSELGEGLIGIRETGIDSLEAVFVRGVRRLDKSGKYAADGAVGIVAWLRDKCRLSGGAAAERVTIGRQLEQLPQTQKAFAGGDLGYQHVAVIARAAEHVGSAAIRKEETGLIKAAETMDAGQFTNHAKHVEHRIDAAGALAESNRAYEKRYLHIGEAVNGLVRLEGLLDAEGGATLRTRLNALMLPSTDDTRTPPQRRADALIDLCHQGGARKDGSGPRPQLVIRASVDTLAGTASAPAGDLEWGGPIPAETVRRLACDAALTRITGQGELDAEVSRATRTIPPATRRALAARDLGCVAEGCGRPPDWTDAHHLKHWVHGGETTMSNLVLLCRRHHRMVHEEGWGLRRATNGRWALSRPFAPHARSA